MNNKILYTIIVLLLAIIVGGGTYYFLNQSGNKSDSGGPAGGGSGTASPSTSLENQTFSEQPDKNKFNEFFSDAYLGKLPVGAKFDPFKVIRANTYSAGEQFCIGLELKKIVPANTLGSAVYDVNTRQNVRPMAFFPKSVGPGGTMGCEGLQDPPGKYELKVYIDRALAVILPFEVKN